LGLSGLAAGAEFQASTSIGPETSPVLVAGATATRNLFSVLGTRPALGRLFLEDAGQPTGGGAVVVLSHRFWMRHFGGDRSVLGRTMHVNRVPLTIIGVAEEGFHGHLPLYDFSLFVPMEMREALTGRSLLQAKVATVGRLASGASIQRVGSAADRLAEALRSMDPVEWTSSVFLVEPHTRSYQEFRGPISLYLAFLLALSGCVLLIACTNLAGLLLSRAVSRAHEHSVMQALGAGRRRLVGRLLAETLLLFAAGGVAGSALAFWATRVLGGIRLPMEIPLTGDYAPDLRVLSASMAVLLLSGLVFGLAPALRATRSNVRSILKGPRGETSGRHRLRKAFVLVQVAGSVVLLGGGALLVKALTRADAMELGFEPDGVHVATLNLGIQQYGEDEGRMLLSRVLSNGAALPGVESAALSSFVFLATPPRLSGSFSGAAEAEHVTAGIFTVSPGFFRTTGTAILEGRPFDRSDAADTEPVAIVNDRVARILWPDESAVGRTLRAGGSLYRVVGVAADGKYISIGETDLAGVFLPESQLYSPGMSLLLKVRRGYPDIRGAVQAMVTALDPELPLTVNESHRRLIRAQLIPQQAAAVFALILGILGLFLAAVGLFGTLSFQVSQRAPELAVRIALGARPSSVRRSVVGSGLALVLGGLVVGIPVAAGVASMIRRFLFGVDPVDPTILTGAALVLCVIGFLASYIPARRATGIDPSRVLRGN
jgi:predicted permease